MDMTATDGQVAAGMDIPAPDAWRTGAALAMLSHDLRTPLNAIVGFGQLLADQAVPMDELAMVARDIVQSGETLLMHIIDLLRLASLETGQLPLSLECGDAGAAARGALERLAPALAAAGQSVEYVATDGLPPIIADSEWLEVSLDRLFTEVQQAAPAGDTLVIGTCAAEGRVGITIRAGCGVAHNSDRATPHLGLLYAHRAVAMMGGTIVCRPTREGDATWTLWLPTATPLGEPGKC